MKHFILSLLLLPKPLLEPKHFPLVTFFFPHGLPTPSLLGGKAHHAPSKIKGYELFNGSHLFGHMSHEEVYIFTLKATL